MLSLMRYLYRSTETDMRWDWILAALIGAIATLVVLRWMIPG